MPLSVRAADSQVLPPSSGAVARKQDKGDEKQKQDLQAALTPTLDTDAARFSCRPLGSALRGTNLQALNRQATYNTARLRKHKASDIV